MDSSSVEKGDDGKAASAAAAAAAAVNDDMLVKTETTPDINLNDNDALSQFGRENKHPPPPPPLPFSHSSPSVADNNNNDDDDNNNNNNDKVDEEITNAHTPPPPNPPCPADNCQDLQPKSPNNDAHCTPNQPNIDAKTLSTIPDGTADLHPVVLNENEKGEKLRDGLNKLASSPVAETEKEGPVCKLDAAHVPATNTPNKSFHFDSSSLDGYDSGTEEEQAAFLKEVESFYRDNYLEFKPPRFYKEELNLLKLWRAVIKLGGYEQVTSCKLWRQVGESFRPPKTCTTVSWTFRIFYEKALLEYEKHKLHNGELPFSDGSFTESVRTENQASGGLAVGSGRARRDAAARARKHWSPIIKDKNLSPTPKIDKPSKTNGLLKRKKPSTVKHAVHSPQVIPMSALPDAMVIDIGPPAEWVKINVQKTNDCFEIYALVPGLLREEVHVQSDPAGRLIISGQPEQMENPWGVTPFRKVVSLPCRIDPHQTSAVVTLHGQLFVRVPYEQSDT